MRKVFSLWLLATVFLATVHSSHAQQPEKVFRIGYLSTSNPTRESSRAEGIRLALRERSYVEGKNLVIEYRYGDGKVDRYPQVAAEIVRLKVDLIISTGGAPLVQAAKDATKSIPIVMFGPFDPIETKLVDSLARPGGNATGVTNLGGELHGKRLELLKQAVPKLSRVAVPYDPTIPAFVRSITEVLPVAARALGLTLQPWAIRSTEDFDGLFAAMIKQRSDGLLIPGSPLDRINEDRIVAFTLKNQLPSVYFRSEAVDAGALMSYAADQPEGYRRVAYFVDRILKGSKPADLPVEQPTKFEFVVNLKTAKQIGLSFPPELLARATRIIR